MTALNIVRVTPFFDPASRFGGCVTQGRATSRALAARGHRVSVLSSDLGVPPELPRDVWLDEAGFRVRYASTRRPHRVPPYWPPRIGATLDAELRDADVLCLNVGLNLWNATARRIAARRRVPYVYNAEGALCPTRLAIKRWSKLVFTRLFERRIIRGAAAVQAVTDREAGDLARQGADPRLIHVIPNGVDVGTPVDTDGWRAAHGIADDATVVLFLGRLHHVKGLDLLLDAIAPLCRDRRELRAVIAGPDDGARAELEQRAARLDIGDRVLFPGLLAGDEKRAALGAADLFALTSRSEGLPNAVLEAAAAALPLVITEGCNVPEVATYSAGFVTPFAVEPVHTALAELVDDLDLRSRCAQNAQRMAHQVFALSVVVDRLEAMLRSVARS